MKEIKNNMSKMTTISTTYARICILLLAVNFVLTGYAITSLARFQAEAGENSATGDGAAAQAAETNNNAEEGKGARDVPSETSERNAPPAEAGTAESK